MTTPTTTPVTREALLPCPFCGADAVLKHGGPGNWFAQCEACRASTDDGSQDRATAVWNRRASPIPTTAEEQFALSAAAQAFCNRGIAIACPWEGDLDDAERERFDALVAAIECYNTALSVAPFSLTGVTSEYDL